MSDPLPSAPLLAELLEDVFSPAERTWLVPACAAVRTAADIGALADEVAATSPAGSFWYAFAHAGRVFPEMPGLLATIPVTALAYCAVNPHFDPASRARVADAIVARLRHDVQPSFAKELTRGLVALAVDGFLSPASRPYQRLHRYTRYRWSPSTRAVITQARHVLITLPTCTSDHLLELVTETVVDDNTITMPAAGHPNATPAVWRALVTPPGLVTTALAITLSRIPAARVVPEVHACLARGARAVPEVARGLAEDLEGSAYREALVALIAQAPAVALAALRAASTAQLAALARADVIPLTRTLPEADRLHLLEVVSRLPRAAPQNGSAP